MPTQQLAAGFNASSGCGSATPTAFNAAAAALNGSASIRAHTASLFLLLSDFINAEETDPSLRTNALSLLVAYHVCTLANEEHTALEVLQRINDDVTLLCDHLWGNYGRKGLPVDRPLPGQLEEFESAVATERANQGLKTLPGTSY